MEEITCGQIIESQNGDITVLEEIPGGAMGQVFRAKMGGVTIAIKVIKAALCAVSNISQRFVSEATALQQLASPYTVRLLDFFKMGKRWIMAMEWAEGVTLETVLTEVGILDPLTSLKIIQQVCCSLEEAHDHGIVHRDIKPANIMIAYRNGKPVVKVMDFGIARLPGSSLTAVGGVMGTPGYMSPEQAKGENHKVGPPTDVFAVGAVLYRAIVGSEIFSNDGNGLFFNNRYGTPLSIRDDVVNIQANVFIRMMLARCLALDPAERYQDAGALKKVVKEAIRAIEIASSADAAGRSTTIAFEL